MPEEQLEQVLLFLKTLADQTRLRILGLLAHEERSVEEVAGLLDLRPPTVSWHLSKLKDIDLVTMRVDGNTHLYRLNGKGLGRINKLLATPESIATLTNVAEDFARNAWEQKVLRDFFENGRLKQIPSYRKARSVILRWLAEQFELGHTYSERELNETIMRYHPDYATLRREMIGAKLIQREQVNGQNHYWRTQQPEDTAVPAQSASPAPKAQSSSGDKEEKQP